jgi:hypothetical protein
VRIAFEPSLAGKAIGTELRLLTARDHDKDGKAGNNVPNHHSTSAILS